MTDSAVDSKTEVKQATKYVKETENVAEKYSALTVSKNSSDVNMNVGEMPSAAFTAVPTLKSVKKVRNVMPAITCFHWAKDSRSHVRRTRSRWCGVLCCSRLLLDSMGKNHSECVAKPHSLTFSTVSIKKQGSRNSVGLVVSVGHVYLFPFRLV